MLQSRMAEVQSIHSLSLVPCLSRRDHCRTTRYFDGVGEYLIGVMAGSALAFTIMMVEVVVPKLHGGPQH